MVIIIIINPDIQILAEHEEAMKNAKQLLQNEHDEQIKALQGNRKE